jgi:hypothetical protein
MDVLFKKAFKFNLDNLSVVEMPIPVPTQQDLDNAVYTFDAYLNELIKTVLDDDRSKKFLFPDVNSAIKTDMSQIVVEASRNQAAKSVAERLLSEERSAEAKVEHLKIEIQKGIVVQALVNYGTATYYLIIKAEHQDYMNENDNRKSTGLPIKKKIFKSFSAKLDADMLPVDAMVGDTTARISTYWWDDFLKLIPERTDEYNTLTAFDAFERKIFNRMKDQHPEDMMTLRNATLSYFRSHDEFVLADYLNEVVNTYHPADEELDVPKMVEKINALPEAEEFEPRFIIKRDNLKKRIKRTVRLNDQLNLVMLGEVTPGTVYSIKKNGIKYVRIQSDEGYEQFPKLDDNN